MPDILKIAGGILLGTAFLLALLWLTFFLAGKLGELIDG